MLAWEVQIGGHFGGLGPILPASWQWVNFAVKWRTFASVCHFIASKYGIKIFGNTSVYMSPTMMNGLEKNPFKVSHTAAVASPWKKIFIMTLNSGQLSLCHFSW